ncbi:MAG: hypothetical protein IJ809_06270 [Clostridia bacterium]|nr:hypothetical protein [Clostridia bacterium]
MVKSKTISSEVANKELYEKSKKVSKGIIALIWAHINFYIEPHIMEDIKEYGVNNVFINADGKFSVKLDDGTDFILIQPCPWLIYELYESKLKIETCCHCNQDTIRKANACEKIQ